MEGHIMAERDFQESILERSLERWSEEEEEEIVWVKAEELAGKDANLGVDQSGI